MKRILAFLATMVFLVSSLTGVTSNAVKDTLVKSVSITGEITMINPGVPYNNEVLALKTGKEIYMLTGKTTGMNKYIGYSAKITGTISKGPQGIMMFNVKTYKIIAKSSPTPILTPTPTLTLIPGPTTVPVPSEPPVREVTLQGYLSNLNSDKFKFYLETKNGLYELIGNTKGMETVCGNMIEVTGSYVKTLVATEVPMFNVVSYKVVQTPSNIPIPTPVPTQALKYLQGTLLVNETYPLTFELKTSDGQYTLKGNTEGMEKYANMRIEVSGSVSPLKIYPPIFNVVSYRLLPEPTSPVSKKVHTIISDKPLFFSEPMTGNIGSPGAISGFTTVSWSEDANKAFFSSKFTVLLKGSKINYQIELVEATSTSIESIKGKFNITRDGEMICKEVAGELYGLTLPVGEYFKFYTTEPQINLSAYITQRLDF